MLKLIYLTGAIFAVFCLSNAQKKIIKQELPVETIFQKIDSLEKAGLPQSAFNLADELYQKALIQQNTNLFVKTLVLRMKYREDITEESLVVFINELETQLPIIWEPARQLVHSMLADLYQWYYNKNKWKLLEQKQVETGSNDIREMSAAEISAKAIHHYRQSLQNSALLQKELLVKYRDILIKESDKFNLRPTLFDFLSVKAIEAILTDALFQMPTMVHPVFDNPEILGSIDQFLAVSFDDGAKDNAALEGLVLLQNWLSFRKQMGEPEPLYDADLSRLKWLSLRFGGDKFEDLYENALTRLAGQSRKSSVYADVQYQKALFLTQLGNAGMGKETGRNYLKEAISVAQQGINAWPKSEGAALCRSLIEQINQPMLAVVTENALPTGTRLAYKVDYKNIKQVYVNVYRLQVDENGNRRRHIQGDAALRQIKKNKPVHTEVRTLPDFKDYLMHSAELNLPGIAEPGLYAILVTPKPVTQDIDKAELFSLTVLPVTNLTISYRQTDDGKLDILVLHRTSGKAIKDAEVSVYTFENYTSNKKVLAGGKTDVNGRLILNFPYRNSVEIEAKLGNDVCQTENVWIRNLNDNYEERFQSRAFIFTDRKIYRPGQMVWVKGIFMETNGKEARSIKEQDIILSFRDVNGQELTAIERVTNEYGSVEAVFTIPQNVLTGTFTINSPFGSQYINVENYKRPRFEIEMNPFKEVVLLGEAVKTSGKATDYTGAPLQGAKVSWRVTRQVRMWRHWGVQKPVSIASGTGFTGSNGEFDIVFQSVPSSKKKKKFTENFIVEVDVTDINGETRSQTQTITLGDSGFYLSVILKKDAISHYEKELPVTLSINNQSGESVKRKVQLSISKLIVPKKLLPYRYWELPDTILWKGAIYNIEREAWNHWEVESVVKTETLKLEGELLKKVSFDKELEPGMYKVSLESIDKNGELRKTDKVFYVFGADDKPFNPGSGIKVFTNKKEFIPGEQLVINLASAFQQGTVYLFAWNENKTFLEKEIDVSRISDEISIPINTSMEGSILVNAFLIQQNRKYEDYQRVEIINPARQLNIRLQSFRDKVQPGSTETWKLNITDGNENSAQVELLALMYDSSLDYFAPNQLQMKLFYPRYGYNKWVNNSFSDGYAWNRNDYPVKGVDVKPYPTFNWFGYQYGWGFGHRMGQPMMLKSANSSLSGSVVEVVEDDLEIEIHDSEDVTGEVKNKSKPIVEPVNMVRRQLQETAFFMPMLKTDDNGDIQFSFTMPESVTKWRFMALAHRPDGASGTVEQFITSSREVMVMPNLPRVVREGDVLTLSTKIVNTTDSVLTGTAWLKLKDAVSGHTPGELSLQPVNWHLEANATTTASWTVKVPTGIKGLVVTVSAATEEFQDGEEHLIPVLPVKMLITESLPVTLSGKGKHTIKMESLAASRNKEHQSFTFTYTQNAAWEMLGVLPWLMERPYENSDQIFNRYFAVSVAKKIFNEHPHIEQVLKAWAAALPGDENALLSALEKNPELKNTVLAATPWLTEAKNDTERRRRLASLVAAGHLDAEQNAALAQLTKLQMGDGAWPWFSGMMPSEFVTAEIVAGFGYLKRMGISLGRDAEQSQNRAVDWLRNQLLKSKENALKNLERQATINKDTVIVLGWNIVKNLYALSFFASTSPSEGEQFWMDKLRKHYRPTDVTAQAMKAVILWRFGFKTEALPLVASIKEKAIRGERGQWFFKTVTSPFWYEAPIERQVIVLEALRELEPGSAFIAGMEDWLMSQKRTQHWRTTRGTVSAVYGLASSSRQLFAYQKPDDIKVGRLKIKPSKTVSGSGYFSQTWTGTQVNSALGVAEVKKGSAHPSWASMHWSYWEEEANVQKGGFLDVSKTVFKRLLKDGEEIWYPLSDSVRLNTGDRLMVRLLIETPQALDFAHVNDKRASVLEPLDVMSGYVWKSGLGYYASVTDAGVDFFIDHLPKGKYTLTYEMVVSHKGLATSGPAVVQCFYAPEFSGHSAGSVFSTSRE